MTAMVRFLLICLVGAGCGHSNSAFPDDLMSSVRVVLLQHSPWMGGFDRPLFIAYADGTVLFSRRYTDGIPVDYGVVRLAPEDLNKLLGAIGAATVLEQLDSRYDFAPDVTDQHSFYLLIAEPSSTRLVTIRAGLKDHNTLRPEVPEAFRRFYASVTQYSPPTATAWTPDSVEVSIWPYEYAPDDPPLAWPAQWPGLSDARWHRQADEFVGEMRTLRLAFTESFLLDSLLETRRTKQAIGISGKKWAMGYRWVFPHERSWQRIAQQLEY